MSPALKSRLKKKYLLYFQWVLRYSSTIILAGTLSVDTFFVISGLLATYSLCEYLSKGHKFNLWYYYFHRYIRITPSLAVVVFLVATVAHRFGSGPLWKASSAAIQKPCQYFWWSTVLHLQNYVNPKYLVSLSDIVCVFPYWPFCQSCFLFVTTYN